MLNIVKECGFVDSLRLFYSLLILLLLVVKLLFFSIMSVGFILWNCQRFLSLVLFIQWWVACSPKGSGISTKCLWDSSGLSTVINLTTSDISALYQATSNYCWVGHIEIYPALLLELAAGLSCTSDASLGIAPSFLVPCLTNPSNFSLCSMRPPYLPGLLLVLS